LKDNYPKEGIASLKSEWISHLLGHEVVSFEHTILDQGALSDAAIIRPDYKTAGAGPASFVLKYAKDSQAGRDIAKGSNAYDKEMKFYSNLRNEVNEFLPCAEVFWQYQDPEEPESYFVIAMEDLSVKYDVMSLVTGITKP
jgi:hypothetical protein